MFVGCTDEPAEEKHEKHNFVYVCLWATRGTEVTFSNISFASDEWVSA